MYCLCVLLSKHSYDNSKKFKYVSKCWMLLVETVFCKSNVIQGLSNSAAPQLAPRVTRFPSLPSLKELVPGESFTTLSAPLRVTFSLHCSIGVITCVLAQWLYPCAICRYRAFKSMRIFCMCSLHCMCSPHGCWDYFYDECIVMHMHTVFFLVV